MRTLLAGEGLGNARAEAEAALRAAGGKRAAGFQRGNAARDGRSY
jgi:hypothetical protein